MKKIQKTNAMRFLDQHKVEYEAHSYDHKEGIQWMVCMLRIS